MTSSELAREAWPRRIMRRLSRMMGPKGVFLEGFIEHPVMVGSIIPSSRFTIAKMLAPVKWDECKVFVEYGPGVGTFCRPVLNRLRRDGQLIVIDTNPLYIDYLRATITDSRFSAVLGSAADVEDRVGMLASITTAVTNFGISFINLQVTSTGDGKAVCTFEINIEHISQLENVTRKLEAITGVIRVEHHRHG